MLGGCATPAVREQVSVRAPWGAAAVLKTAPGSTLPMDEPRGELPGEEILRVSWRRQLTDPGFLQYKPQEFASAVSDGRRVYIGSRSGYFFALRTSDGTILWRRRIEGDVALRPLFVPNLRLTDEPKAAPSGGVIFLGTSEGVVYALDAATGKEFWIYRAKSPIVATPVMGDGLLYFTTGENRLYALDLRTGAWKWQYEREPPDGFTIRGAAGPLLVKDRLYAGFADGYLVALAARDGEVVWARALGNKDERFVDVDATPSLVGGTLYVSSYAGGIYALDPADGAVRWRYEVEGAGTVRVVGDRIYFSAPREGLHCLDLEGQLVWRQALADNMGELSAPVMLGQRYLLMSASERGTFVVDAMDGRLVQFFRTAHGVSSEPTNDGRQVFILTNAGTLYAFTFRA